MNAALPERSGDALIGAVIAFTAIVAFLAVLYRKLQARAASERADAVLAAEIDEASRKPPARGP